MTIYGFAEGQTEENVIQHLILGNEITFPNIQDKDQIQQIQQIKQGKDQINPKIRNVLEPLLQSPGEIIRCLVLRDLDEHEGEQIARLVQSVTKVVQDTLTERGFADVKVTLSPHSVYTNVYTFSATQPEIRLAFHIADFRRHQQFIKCTIDDYVLDLALRDTTVQGLLNKKGWTTTPEQIIRKITAEIPTLLFNNGILLRETKDYVRLYAAVMQEHTSPPVFAKNTLAHADQKDREAVFAPLLAAIEFIRE